MNFYLKSLRALHEADAPALMNPAYWAWITARSSDERLLYLTSRGDTDALKRVLLQIERRGVREEDLPFRRGDIRQQIVRAQARPLDLDFLTWALRFASPLEELEPADTEVSDLSPVSSLTQLQVLGLARTSVSDLSPVRGLLQLQTLDLDDTPVSDLSPLRGLTQLQTLYLSRTSVSDLSPLARLSQLQTLHLARTSVSDLSPLARLSQLEWLSLLACKQVRDVTPLHGLTQLTWLNLDDTSATPAQIDALRAALPNCRILL